MTLQETIKIFKKNYPDLIPWSYYTVSDGIIINTKQIIKGSDTAPAQYIVKPDGTTYGVNPLMYDYGPKDFKRIPLQMIVGSGK